MRINSIRVKGLFGIFDHEIPLRSAERVTLIHGPNGFGKTVMLRMIAAFFQGDTSVFRHTPFDEFAVAFDDGSSYTVRREASRRSPQGAVLTLLAVDANGKESSGSFGSAPPKKVMDSVDELVPMPYRRLGDGWTDGRSQYSLQEILKLFPRAKSALPLNYRDPRLLQPAGVAPLAGTSVFFIETNRLGQQGPSLRRNVSRWPRALRIGAGGEALPYEPDPDDLDAEEPSLRVEQYVNRDMKMYQLSRRGNVPPAAVQASCVVSPPPPRVCP